MKSSRQLVGSGLKLTCSRDELVEKLARRLARCVDAIDACRSSRASCSAPSEGTLELAATDMELSLRSSLEAEIAGRGRRGRARAGCSSTSRACCRTADVEIEHKPEEGARRGRLRHGDATSCTRYSAEDFPRLPEVDAAQTFTRRPRRRCSRRSRGSAAPHRGTSRARC